MQETHDLPAQDPRGPRACDPRGDRAAARQGGVSRAEHASSSPEARVRRASRGDGPAARAASFEATFGRHREDDGPLRDARRRAGRLCAHLRDNGFTVGLAETRDALAILASPAAPRPPSLSPAFRALFCADRIPTGSVSTRSSMPTGSGAPTCGSAQVDQRRGRAQAKPPQLAKRPSPRASAGMPDRVERAPDGDGDAPATAAAGARAPRAPRASPRPTSATSSIPTTSRRRTRSRRGWPARCARGWCAASSVRRRGRAARPAPHHPPQRLAWRHADRARLAAAQDRSRCGSSCCSMPPAR